MEVQEHEKTALGFLEAADREFALGDELQGSEKLWGAARHAVMMVAQKRGWPYSKHSAIRNAVNRIALEYDDEFLKAGFSIAEGLHANFYHGFKDQESIAQDRPLVRRFVERMLFYAPDQP